MDLGLIETSFGGGDAPVAEIVAVTQLPQISLKVTVPLILLGFAVALSALNLVYQVPRAERAVDPRELALAHVRYAAERDAAVPPEHRGPRPTGGVGGTRRGVKCLHAHYAWYLAGGDDPVGRWVHDQMTESA